MSAAEQAATSAAATTTAAEGSILEQAIAATKQTERDRAQDLIKTLTEEALKGTLTWSKDVTTDDHPGHQGDRRSALQAIGRRDAPPQVPAA